MNYNGKKLTNLANEKASFVLALVVLLIAIVPYHNELSKIKVNFGFVNTDILILICISLVLLAASLYLYTLDYARYGFKKLEGLLIFKYLQVMANALYLLAVVSPIIYLLIWVAYSLFKLILLINIIHLYIPDIRNILGYLSAIVAIAATVIFCIVSWLQMKDRILAQEESIDEDTSEATIKVHKLIDKKMWALVIIEGFKTLELNARKKLLEIGIEAERIPFLRSIEILKQHGILTEEELDKINFIRMLRNKAIHTETTFEEYQAKDTIQDINKILPKFETSTTSAFMFEKGAIEALGGTRGKRGLFLRHHIFLEPHARDLGYDAKAEGPNYTYLIAVKLAKNPLVIENVIKQLKCANKTSSRLIIIVPTATSNIDIHDPDVKILYYNAIKKEFENYTDVYNWINNSVC